MLAGMMVAAGLCVFGLGGTPNGSTAVPLHPNDAAQVARLTVEHLTERFPPAASTVLLVGPKDCGKGDTFTPALTGALRKAGFALASDRAVSRDAQEVRYHLTGGWQDSVILRLEVNNQSSAQLFSRSTDGVLREAGPRTVRQANDHH